MIRRILFYTVLPLRDLFRLRSATRLQVAIVAGVCFPILVLLALKRGHVEELRRDLATSPTGREVKLYCSNDGEFFHLDSLDETAKQLGQVELMIPEIKRTCRLTSVSTQSGEEIAVDGVDLIATLPGDPVLADLGADILHADELGVVLLSHVAGKLDVSVGDSISITAFRGNDENEASIEMIVRGVIPSPRSSLIGYLNTATLQKMVIYVRGGAVPEWDWQAMNKAIVDRYREIMLVAERIDPLTQLDINALDRLGFFVEEITDLSKLEFSPLLNKTAKSALIFYRIFKAGSSASDLEEFVETPETITGVTSAGDVAIPWSTPRMVLIEGKAYRMIGLQLPKEGAWLRKYFKNPLLPFSEAGDPLRVRSVDGSRLFMEDLVHIQIKDGLTVSVEESSVQTKPKGLLIPPPPPIPDNVDAADHANSQSPDRQETVIAPLELLLHLDSIASGRAEYDANARAFVPSVPTPSYEEARAYASSIDDVLDVVERARGLGYGFQANNGRIKEIQDQDHSLQLLVIIVAVAVFLFGVLTIVAVLVDSTDRKRNMIGVLRVMGASSYGIFYFVLLRAVLIGLLAGGVTCLAGWGFVKIFSFDLTDAINTNPGWESAISAVVLPSDLLLIFLGSILCCGVGAIYPAWRASRLDPIEAVIEGRFR